MDLHPTFVGVMELSMDEEAAGPSFGGATR